LTFYLYLFSIKSGLSPDVSDDFAANVQLASFSVSYDALRCGNDSYAKSLKNLGKLFSTGIKLVDTILYKLGAFPVSRGEADLSSIRTSLSILKDGHCLLIFGQGTRRKKTDTQEPPMHTGVAMLAVRSKAPVVPVYIKPPYRIFRRMRVYIGKPLDFSDIRRADSATLQNVTDQISGAIFSMDKPALNAPEAK